MNNATIDANDAKESKPKTMVKTIKMRIRKIIIIKMKKVKVRKIMTISLSHHHHHQATTVISLQDKLYSILDFQLTKNYLLTSSVMLSFPTLII